MLASEASSQDLIDLYGLSIERRLSLKSCWTKVSIAAVCEFLRSKRLRLVGGKSGSEGSVIVFARNDASRFPGRLNRTRWLRHLTRVLWYARKRCLLLQNMVSLLVTLLEGVVSESGSAFQETLMHHFLRKQLPILRNLTFRLLNAGALNEEIHRLPRCLLSSNKISTIVFSLSKVRTTRSDLGRKLQTQALSWQKF